MAIVLLKSVPSPTSYQLPYANITWQDDQTPFAQDYEDVYWSNKGGLEEKQYVFIEGCELIKRWQQLKPNDTFSIVELGFGFGLNFLLSLRCWINANQDDRCHLDYVSYEQHLVPLEALKKIANHFGLEAECKLLESHYPKPVPGVHTMWLSENCCLHLVIGDACAYAPSLKGPIDALFLDGFSPKLNEQLWREPLVAGLAKQLRPGGIAATYTVAGDIRRGLLDANLRVDKLKGFGKKRHMMVAHAQGAWTPQRLQPKRIGIVGAGLTGLFCAQALERYGHHVTIIDSNTKHGAVSDIHQIAIYPQLSQTPQNYSNLYLRAFSYFQNHQNFKQCGRLELLTTPEKNHKAIMLSEQLEGILELLSASQCSELLGFKVSEPGLFTPNAGWLEPQTIGQDRNILKGHVRQLIPNIANTGMGWTIEMDTTALEVDVVILACGPYGFRELEPLGLLPLRGQSLRINQAEISPNCVFSNEKTWFPTQRNETTVSGTYSRTDFDKTIRDEDSQELLQSVQPYLNGTPTYSAQVGIRSAARDRLPIVDQIPNWESLNRYISAPPPGPSWSSSNKATTKPLAKSAAKADGFTDFAQGLYCSVGFGSHAGTLGPYCAEIISRKINNQILAEDTHQISSSRFALRDKKH